MEECLTPLVPEVGWLLGPPPETAQLTSGGNQSVICDIKSGMCFGEGVNTSIERLNKAEASLQLKAGPKIDCWRAVSSYRSGTVGARVSLGRGC